MILTNNNRKIIQYLGQGLGEIGRGYGYFLGHIYTILFD